MDGLKPIMNRRSCRQYSKEMVTKEQLDVLIKAGFAAPSASNKQPWEFIVVQEQDTIKRVAEVKNNGNMMVDAGTLFVICGDTTKQLTELIVQDASAVTQNILLAAECLGLGGVWISCYPREHVISGVKDIFNLPEHIMPITMITVGNKVNSQPPLDKYDVNKLHIEKW